MITSGIRVIKFAFQDFFRNFWLSLVTLTILVLALIAVNVLIVFNVVTKEAIRVIEDKIDVTVYFRSDIKDDQILNVQQYLLGQDAVAEVNYISRDQALKAFREKHRDNERIIASIEAIDTNPLG